MRLTYAAALVLIPAFWAQAQEPRISAPFTGDARDAPREQHLTVAAVPSHLTIKAGQTCHIAVEIQIESGWAYYSPDQIRKDVKPGRITVKAEGLTVGEPLWPQSHQKITRLPQETLVHNVFEGRTIVYVPISAAANAEAGAHNIFVTVEGQVCEKVCIDLDDVTADASVAVAAVASPNPKWAAEPAFAAGLTKALAPKSDDLADAASIWPKLVLALLAGLTLNIMPCVLPIIPLRVHSVVEMAKGSRRRFITLGLAFAGGICLFFLAFAAANISLKLLAGRALNWNEQWQLPAVRIGMGLLVVAVAANFFGAFTVTVPRKLAGLEATADKRHKGHLASLGMGLMMAILATPCTVGPLVTVVGWAQLQSLWLGTAAVVLLGIGMAAPHAALCAFPKLVEKLPRPGRWMELFKQTMGFLLLPLAIFLFTTVGDVPQRVARVMYFGVLFCFALWVWGTWVRFDTPGLRKWTVRSAAIALVIVAGLWLLPEPAKPLVKFQDFDEAKIEAARRDGKAVLIKFTASWCIECKIIDAFVYNTPEVAGKLKDPNILVVKGDVSNRKSLPTVYAKKLKLGWPPITLIYPAGPGDPIRLLGSLSKDRLLAALSQATSPKKMGS